MKKTKTCIKERIVGGIILYQVARAANKGLFEVMSRKREKYLVRYQKKCVSGKGNCHCKGPRKMLVPHVQRQMRKPAGQRDNQEGE